MATTPHSSRNLSEVGILSALSFQPSSKSKSFAPLISLLRERLDPFSVPFLARLRRMRVTHRCLRRSRVGHRWQSPRGLSLFHQVHRRLRHILPLFLGFAAGESGRSLVRLGWRLRQKDGTREPTYALPVEDSRRRQPGVRLLPMQRLTRRPRSRGPTPLFPPRSGLSARVAAWLLFRDLIREDSPRRLREFLWRIRKSRTPTRHRRHRRVRWREVRQFFFRLARSASWPLCERL